MTVLLNTGAPGFVSGSAQKYPSRSNWKRAPGPTIASDGSTLHPVNRSSERGFRSSSGSRSPSAGFSDVNSRS